MTKGTQYENTGWIFDVDNPLTFTIGQDDINVIQFSGTGSFLAGNGLELDGNEFLIDTDIVVDKTSNQTIGGTKIFSNTISGSVDGNAGTATVLENARNINGTSFNGSANITTAN